MFKILDIIFVWLEKREIKKYEKRQKKLRAESRKKRIKQK